MAFPNDLWVASAYNGNVYNYVKDAINGSVISLGDTNKPQGVCVSQDQKTVYIANRENSSISIIANDQYIGDVMVGNEPYGICEGLYNDIYVACYHDNAVYKIEQDNSSKYKVSAIINVDDGPSGICCDSDGTIWVACANAATVCKIVNSTVVMHIDTGDDSIARPTGICCDSTDNIWVANYTSNTVVKINHSHKILTVQVDGGPIDLVTDSANNVYVACYLGDKITYIPGSDPNNTEDISLPSGSGVTAIDVNSEDDVYAIGSLSNKIFKIHKKQVVKTITTGDSTPVGFGDFTGCRAFNVFNTNSKKGTNADTPTDSLIRLMGALKLKFKVKDIKEGSTMANITVYSDTIDLTSFDHVKLNGTSGIGLSDGSYSFSIPSIPAINTLDLVGYFDAAETLPARFIPIDYSKVYKILVGSLKDDGSGNYVFSLATTQPAVVNVDDDVNSVVVETTADGNIAVLVPSKADAAIKKGIVVNGMQIYEDWAIDPSIQAAISSAISAYPNYVAYMNPYEAYKGTAVILNRYKL